MGPDFDEAPEEYYFGAALELDLRFNLNSTPEEGMVVRFLEDVGVGPQIYRTAVFTCDSWTVMGWNKSTEYMKHLSFIEHLSASNFSGITVMSPEYKVVR